jgi:hypothetical protein
MRTTVTKADLARHLETVRARHHDDLAGAWGCLRASSRRARAGDGHQVQMLPLTRPVPAHTINVE